MRIHPLITDSATLEKFCERLARSDFVAVDTEFMRENTYWPELCLIQLANSEEAAAIDPKADGIDLTPLLNLLVNNEHVLKVFHAGGQDIEIVFNLTGGTPHPLFDTQIAAMALGLGEQVGYQNLVESLLGRILDKGARFTDWARRPLDKRQIDYAIGDVTHLAELFPKMLERLRRTGRGDWLDQEMERIADPANYLNDPALAWKRVKIQTRRPDALGRLKALAAWRELEARGKNLPRGRIMKDETMADVAMHPPASQEALGQVRGLSAAWKGNDIGARMMEALANAQPLSPSELPVREDRGPGLGREGALVADLLKLLLKIRARESNVAPRLVAKSEELEMLAAGRREGLAILEGWRFEEFGRDALDLVEGRLAFAIRRGKLIMTRTALESDNEEPDRRLGAEPAGVRDDAG
jgi:ribonuclease D